MYEREGEREGMYDGGSPGPSVVTETDVACQGVYCSILYCIVQYCSVLYGIVIQNIL